MGQSRGRHLPLLRPRTNCVDLRPAGRSPSLLDAGSNPLGWGGDLAVAREGGLIIDDCELSALVERALAGNARAREKVARHCLELALRTAIAVLGGRQNASDVAQDVAVEVLRGLPALREPARLDAWVHRITVRRALRALRTRRLLLRRERSLSDLAESEEPAAAVSPSGPALSPALHRALLSLPARQRLAIALRYLQDLSEDQVAAALGCSPGTAASMLSRARASLREAPGLRALLHDLDEGETS